MELKRETFFAETFASELEELRRSDLISRTILENISDMVAIHRLSDLGYEYVNPATLRILGCTREELFAMNPLELIHPDDRERVFARMKANMSLGESQDKFRYRRGDGSYVWLKVNGVIVPAEGNESRLILICQDISNEKSLETSLLQAYQELGQLGEREAASAPAAFNALSTLAEIEAAVGNTTEEVLDLALISTENLNEEHLLVSCCQLIVEKPGFSLAWVGFVQEGGTQKVKPVAYAGINSGYLAKLNIDLEDPKRGQGPTGQAIRSGQPVIIPNLKTADTFTPWLKDALRRGFKSCMAVPLTDEGAIFGSLNVYSDRVDGFDPEAQKLLLKIGNKLARTIVALRR